VQINIQNLRSNPLSLEAVIEAGAGPQARIIRAYLTPGESVDVSDVASLEEVNANATIKALMVSGAIRVDIVEQSTDLLSPSSQFNKLRNDVAKCFAAAVEGGATVTNVPYHKCNPASITAESNADAAALPAVIVLANSLRQKLIDHLASTGDVGAHRAASAATVTAAIATDQGTANTLLTMEKARFNTHLTEAGVHMVADAANTVGAADAINLGTSITLANEIKAKYNLHIAAANMLDSLPIGSN
jgi:hypothetical protein